MRREMVGSLAALGLLVLASPALAKTTTISIPIGDVAAYEGARGAFYVVNLAVPADVSGKRLDGVFLEFAVEATPRSLDDTVVSPVVGAYPLRQAFAGGVGDAPGRVAEPVFDAVVPSTQPVAIGDNQVVRMDITEIVNGWLNEPSANHGLVIGSLAGPDVGTIALKNQLPDSEGAIRVTFVYQNRFGDRISSRE